MIFSGEEQFVLNDQTDYRYIRSLPLSTLQILCKCITSKIIYKINNDIMYHKGIKKEITEILSKNVYQKANEKISANTKRNHK